MAADELGDNLRKHLEFVQAVISRLSTDSFLMKGWALTVSTALYAYCAVHLLWQVALLGLLPPLAFWFLDGYFLRQERLYRHLYNEVRAGTVDPFCMDARPYSDRETWSKTILSVTLRTFYGFIIVVGLALMVASLLHN